MGGGGWGSHHVGLGSPAQAATHQLLLLLIPQLFKDVVITVDHRQWGGGVRAVRSLPGLAATLLLRPDLSGADACNDPQPSGGMEARQTCEGKEAAG